MILMPREHGAYGQLTLPVATALAAAGVTASALLLTIGFVAAFAAHEPASILMGLRGRRAARTLRYMARRSLLGCAGVAVVAGTLGVFSMDGAARWSLAVPAAPALLLGICSVRGLEKSWYGEVSAAATLAGLAMPLSMAAGAPARVGAAIAVTFGVLFIAATLAIRTVILRVRGGGAARTVANTRRSAITVAVAALAGLAWLASHDLLPNAPLIAVVPGLMLVLAIVARPPRPARLRELGWSIVATAVFAAAVLIVAV